MARRRILIDTDSSNVDAGLACYRVVQDDDQWLVCDLAEETTFYCTDSQADALGWLCGWLLEGCE